jgi:hypothetical protein
MNDDWRVRVDMREDGIAGALTDRLEAIELRHDLETSFHDRVIVSRDGPVVVGYAGTREQAEGVETLIRSLAAEHGWQLESELKHWHPIAEEWEDPDEPLPRSDAERSAERAALIEQEREESVARGYPEWEVRVECGSHQDALRLATKLRQEGLPNVHRWRYVLVGALDQESAEALADRIRQEVPAASSVTVEGTLRAISDDVPRNPFAVLG